jgi:hypothetical protein
VAWLGVGRLNLPSVYPFSFCLTRHSLQAVQSLLFAGCEYLNLSMRFFNLAFAGVYIKFDVLYADLDNYLLEVSE